MANPGVFKLTVKHAQQVILTSGDSVGRLYRITNNGPSEIKVILNGESLEQELRPEDTGDYAGCSIIVEVSPFGLEPHASGQYDYIGVG